MGRQRLVALAACAAGVVSLAGFLAYDQWRHRCVDQVELWFANGPLGPGIYTIDLSCPCQGVLVKRQTVGHAGKYEPDTHSCRGNQLTVVVSSDYFVGFTLPSTPASVKVHMARNDQVIYDGLVWPNYKTDLHPPRGICIRYGVSLKVDEPEAGH